MGAGKALWVLQGFPHPTWRRHPGALRGWLPVLPAIVGLGRRVSAALFCGRSGALLVIWGVGAGSAPMLSQNVKGHGKHYIITTVL